MDLLVFLVKRVFTLIPFNVLNSLPHAGVVDERDERDEAEVVVDLVLRGAEAVDDVPAHGEQVEVGAVLAGVDEQVAAAERVLELLQRLARLRVLLELRHPELLQQAADELEVLREAAAVALVHPRRGRRLDDEADEAHRVQPRELRDVGQVPHVRHRCGPGFSLPPDESPDLLGAKKRNAAGLVNPRAERRSYHPSAAPEDPAGDSRRADTVLRRRRSARSLTRAGAAAFPALPWSVVFPLFVSWQRLFLGLAHPPASASKLSR